MGCHPSHWRTHIFQDGYCTTNQYIYIYIYIPWFPIISVYSHSYCISFDLRQVSEITLVSGARSKRSESPGRIATATKGVGLGFLKTSRNHRFDDVALAFPVPIYLCICIHLHLLYFVYAYIIHTLYIIHTYILTHLHTYIRTYILTYLHP